MSDRAHIIDRGETIIARESITPVQPPVAVPTERHTFEETNWRVAVIHGSRFVAVRGTWTALNYAIGAAERAVEELGIVKNDKLYVIVVHRTYRYTREFVGMVPNPRTWDTDAPKMVESYTSPYARRELHAARIVWNSTHGQMEVPLPEELWDSELGRDS